MKLLDIVRSAAQYHVGSKDSQRVSLGLSAISFDGTRVVVKYNMVKLQVVATTCTLSSDIRSNAPALGGWFTVDTFGKRGGKYDPYVDGKGIAFPSIGAWMQMESLWQSGYIDLDSPKFKMTQQGSNQLIDIPIWVPQATIFGGDPVFATFTFHYDTTPGSAGDVIIDGPLPTTDINNQPLTLPMPIWLHPGMDIGSLAVLIDGITRDRNAQPYTREKGRSWTMMFNSINFGTAVGDFTPLTVVCSDTNRPVTVYLDQTSHYFYLNAAKSGMDCWSLADAVRNKR
ncbi:MAG: hypothetical protein Q6353_009770 [Candidatus Sigynarchaeum springense]